MEEKKYWAIFAISLADILLMAFLIKITYNAIAWEFNWPQFNYWICLGVASLLQRITAKKIAPD